MADTPADLLPSSSPSYLYRARALTFDHLRSEDPAMSSCIARAKLAADSDIEVLIRGETGTGKNLLALAMHNASRWRDGPFIPLNAAAVPDHLAESELFGHERGAFTGADAEREGLLEQAGGGTLFFDEIGNMSAEVQRKVLTVLEHHTFFRVGGRKEQRLEGRLISATNQDLDAALASGGFRADLLYRIARIVIAVPPLRARPRDLLPMARRFLEEGRALYGRDVRGFTREAENRVLSHPWPGNVRELRWRILGAVALCQDCELGVGELFAAAASWKAPGAPAGSASPASGLPDAAAVDGDLTLATVERRHIAQVLGLTGGNRTRAAEILGISRQALHAKLGRQASEGKQGV